MIVLKCLLGAIAGAIGGLIAVFIGGIAIWIIAGLIMWDSKRGGAVANWAVLFVPAGIVIGIIIPIREEVRRRQKRTAEEVARLQCHREVQQGYRKGMIVLGEHSIGLFESLPKLLASAEKHLDQAEVDFADGAFAPFWNSIEEAAKTLGSFDEGIHHIKDNLSKYSELIRKYDDTPPQFSLAPQSVAKLSVGTATAERMKAIVRTAQRNFQFATIYEQRKTNQILVAGFTNLAEALDRMTWQITASIDGLVNSVAVMTSTLNESMNAIHSQLGDIAEMASGHLSDGAAREKKALEMLDNIQRGRRPSL